MASRVIAQYDAIGQNICGTASTGVATSSYKRLSRGKLNQYSWAGTQAKLDQGLLKLDILHLSEVAFAVALSAHPLSCLAPSMDKG